MHAIWTTLYCSRAAAGSYDGVCGISTSSLRWMDLRNIRRKRE